MCSVSHLKQSNVATLVVSRSGKKERSSTRVWYPSHTARPDATKRVESGQVGRCDFGITRHDIMPCSRNRERKCADTIGTPWAGHFHCYNINRIISQIKCTEAVLSNGAPKLLWLEITKMLVAVLTKKIIYCVVYYNFRHTFVPYTNSER